MSGKHGAHPAYNARPDNLADSVRTAAACAGIDFPTACAFLAAWLRAYNGPRRQRPLTACADSVEALIEP